MTNIISFHDEATKRCIEAGEHLGSVLAGLIMNRVIIYGLGPEEMEVAVQEAMAAAKKEFLDQGASESDTEAICSVIYGALIKKGKEIAILSDWEGGNA
ncbi:hypothetical protein [Brucella intermedia]|uniref:hypothetical protein n=1 Tax=Brucella intermedia TaxID=94625 RepID=UPI002449BB2B|nr:hypothetical protein [Brucella intermedia]WGG58234.1 hypothetical protein QA414_07640 [Brucella intermedia]